MWWWPGLCGLVCVWGGGSSYEGGGVGWQKELLRFGKLFLLYLKVFSVKIKKPKKSIYSGTSRPEKHQYYFILVQGFRVTCLFTGQYNAKGYDTITDVI